jgi:hypothetical protein
MNAQRLHRLEESRNSPLSLQRNSSCCSSSLLIGRRAINTQSRPGTQYSSAQPLCHRGTEHVAEHGLVIAPKLANGWL